MAEATKCEQPFFHVQVRNREGEKLTRQQWETTAHRIMRINGLTGQPYAVAFHIDTATGEEHMHLAVSLIDSETMTAKRLPFYALRLKRISRELETEFGLEPVRNEREGPIKYAAKKDEQQQAQRLGVDKDAIRNSIRHCWDQSDNGRSFQAALEDEGLILAQGDRRDFVVIDHAGGLHGKFSRTLGATANQVREKLADLDPRELPTVKEAQEFVREVAQEHEHSPKPDKLDRLKDELAEIERQLNGPSPEDLKRQLAEIDRLISTAAKEKEPQRETDIPVLAVIRDMEQPPAREPDPEKLRKRELADLRPIYRRRTASPFRNKTRSTSRSNGNNPAPSPALSPRSKTSLPTSSGRPMTTGSASLRILINSSPPKPSDTTRSATRPAMKWHGMTP